MYVVANDVFTSFTIGSTATNTTGTFDKYSTGKINEPVPSQFYFAQLFLSKGIVVASSVLVIFFMVAIMLLVIAFIAIRCKVIR